MGRHHRNWTTIPLMSGWWTMSHRSTCSCVFATYSLPLCPHFSYMLGFIREPNSGARQLVVPEGPAPLQKMLPDPQAQSLPTKSLAHSQKGLQRPRGILGHSNMSWPSMALAVRSIFGLGPVRWDMPLAQTPALQ